VPGPAGDDAEGMPIIEFRRSLGFIARRSDSDDAIRPTATVAGSLPKRMQIPDRVVCRPLDRTTREYLVSRAQKRLVDLSR
jgi:hypothetical protein